LSNEAFTASGKKVIMKELDDTFSMLTNPRMGAGLIILHSLLKPLRGTPVAPREVRETVDRLVDERKVSKQSITNAARRLEEAQILERGEGYSVNYGYLISFLLNTVLDLTKRMSDLEERVEELKRGPT